MLLEIKKAAWVSVRVKLKRFLKRYVRLLNKLKDKWSEFLCVKEEPYTMISMDATVQDGESAEERATAAEARAGDADTLIADLKQRERMVMHENEELEAKVGWKFKTKLRRIYVIWYFINI